MNRTLRSLVIALALMTPGREVFSQAPATPAATTPAPEPAVQLPAPPADYAYDARGRRDPFVSLLKRGTDSGASTGKRADGVNGLQTSEISVRGIVLSRGAWAAMVAGPDGKVYTLRTGDRLIDGTVRTVTAQYLAVVQEVKDPLSPEKQREVRKYLRGGEEVK